MDESYRWRQMFERERPRASERADSPANQMEAAARLLAGLDDGFQPKVETPAAAPPDPAPGAAMPPGDITDDAAMALAEDQSEYRPWVLQRGTRPVMMLHLRRRDPKSCLWMGWEISYPHLIACEYTGDRLLSLDFGVRQFMLEGRGLDELARHLQTGSVLMVQEFAADVWSLPPDGPRITAIRKLTFNPET